MFLWPKFRHSKIDPFFIYVQAATNVNTQFASIYFSHEFKWKDHTAHLWQKKKSHGKQNPLDLSTHSTTTTKNACLKIHFSTCQTETSIYSNNFLLYVFICMSTSASSTLNNSLIVTFANGLCLSVAAFSTQCRRLCV